MNSFMSTFLVEGGTSAVPKAGNIGQMISLVTEASPVIKGVIGLLGFFILACIFIIFYKFIQIRRAQSQTNRFLDIFWESKRLDEIYQAAENYNRSPISQLFKAGYVELSKLKGSTEKDPDTRTDETHAGDIGNVERALRRASTTEVTHLESMVP